jgi:hypothetical protein
MSRKNKPPIGAITPKPIAAIVVARTVDDAGDETF